MNSKNEVKIISAREELKQIFENGTNFLKRIPKRRAMGGETFSEQLIIENVDVQVPMVFGRGDLHDLPISQICCQVKPDLNHEYPHIVFNDGIYKGMHFNGFRLSSEKKIENTYGLYVPELSLEINGGDFYGPIRFSNSQLKSIKITGGIFHSEVCFERGIYDNVEITGGDFRCGLYFGQIIEFNKYSNLHVYLPEEDMPKWTSYENGIYHDVKITGGKVNKAIVMQSCFIKNQLLINSKDIEVQVSNITVQNSIIINEGGGSISGGKVDKLILGGPKITSKIVTDIKNNENNLIQFEGYSGKDSLININSSTSNICKFENFLNYGGISFNNFQLIDFVQDLQILEPSLNAQALNINSFKSALFGAKLAQNHMVIPQINKTYEEALKPVTPVKKPRLLSSSIQIINSDLGKTAFFGCKISNSQLFFKNSKLTEIFLAGTKFPHSKNIEEEQKRLALSQIKKIYESRGDQVTAGDYLFEELEVLRSETRTKKFLDNYDEKISLFLNYHTNRHGNDWRPALYILLIGGLVAWTLICSLLFDIGTINSTSIIVFLDSLSYFFQFLLPIHKYNLLDEFVKEVAGFEKPSMLGKNWYMPVISLIDVFWRVISGYLMYQLIAAFRKHGKR